MKSVVLLSAVEQLALLRDKKISPLELAEEHIQQIERLNPALNALVEFDVERIRAEAREMADHQGPLAGLPITIKSSISVAGYKCEIGSLIRRGEISTEDAVIVARARAAGANLLGTTNCPEFLMAYETDNLLYGRTSNPWSLDRSAGGSSGGEAAAIAAGLSACGFGSDSGGSVREPAHFTGICSLKPTPGRIPGRGHQPPCVGPFAILGAIGPMARTIGDVSLLFHVLSGQDPLDPVGAPAPQYRYTLEELKQIAIGYVEDDGAVTPETRAAVQSAANSLQAQGFSVRPYRPKTLERARELWWTFFVRCGAMFYEPIIRGKEEMLSPIFREFLGIAAADGPLSSVDLLQAWADLDLVRSELLAEMAVFPILLTPVCAVPAFRHGERHWIVEGKTVDYLDAMRFTQWFNLLGAPSAVVPVGNSPEGLPIGVQIAGRPYEDEMVLAIAAAIEHDFGYKAPPMALNHATSL